MEKWEKDCIDAISVNYMMRREELLRAVQWNGNNLEQVIDFVGKSPRFNEWFNSWEEYKQYVKEHNNVVKLFSHTGYNVEVKVGEWIVKLPDGTNVPVRNCWLKEPVSEDLEKKERDESDDELYTIHFEKWNITGECPSELEAKIDAKFGITGRDSNGNPSNGYCDWKKDVFTNGASIYSFVKLGMDYQKEQIMKDAIECEVHCAEVEGIELDTLQICPDGITLNSDDYKDGDKVKVIIIPSEEI